MILNWNGWEDTFSCLRSIHSVDEDQLVWLVDNGSETDRSNEAKAIYPRLRLLRWTDNYGWAGGYNRALTLAASEGYTFAYLLNNDCTVTRGFVTAALNAATQDERIAVVGSLVAYADDSRFLIFDGKFHLPGSKVISFPDDVKLVSEVYGAGLLVRLDAMQQIGYFDERFFCYREETEWCVRAGQRGWKVAVAGKSLIFHRGGASDTDANAAYYQARNDFLLQKRMLPEGTILDRVRLMHSLLSNAQQVRAEGSAETADAIWAGIWDGISCKYGRRGKTPPRLILIPAMRSATYLFFLWRGVKMRFPRLYQEHDKYR
jgi:GT2 family glycosyltransferase